jgi:thiamine pyrophosphokinase
VAGDFDSIRPAVREFYKSQRTVVEHDSDQDSTDFMKCVKFAKQHLAPEFDLIVMGGLGGRVDQSFHSLHHLFLSAFPAQLGAAAAAAAATAEEVESASPLGPVPDGRLDTTRVDTQVYLVSSESVTFLIPEGGAARVRTPCAYLGPTCGLIPLAGPTRITTHGLEWDVSDWSTSFGSRVSTSNHLLRDFTEIETVGNPILFTLELRK